MTVIGLLGKARAGKNFTAKIIKELIPSTEEVALADPIKTIGAKLYAFNDEQAYGKLKETPDERYPRPCHACSGIGKTARISDAALMSCQTCDGTGVLLLTPRWAYQYIGTEVARALYPDTWIDYGLRCAHGLLSGELVKLGPDQYLGRQPGERPKVVCLTDIRFINECKKIREHSGQVWRIVRPNNESNLSAQAKAHRSETEQDSVEIEQYVTAIIVNDCSPEELRSRIEIALKNCGILSVTNRSVA